jgi:GTPase
MASHCTRLAQEVPHTPLACSSADACAVATEGETPGLSPEDMAAAIEHLTRMCDSFDAAVSEIRRRDEEGGHVVEVLLRKR